MPARLKPFGLVYNAAFEEIHVCSIDLYLKDYASNTGIPCRLPALCNSPVLYYETLEVQISFAVLYTLAHIAAISAENPVNKGVAFF